jgi:large subunit ribosomal protein L31
MKTGIHPKLVKSTVTCACGNTWETMSTRESMRTDLCSKCHPFFTGEQRIVDTAGQVERFMRRMGNRTEQANQAQANFKRASKNKANVPPPPQERRPAPVTEEGADEAAADTEAVEA